MQKISWRAFALVFASVCAPAEAQQFPATIALDELAPGQGFRVVGLELSDDLGDRAAGLGDLNRDGFDDVAIAAPRADVTGGSTGSVYVIFGFPAAQLTEFDLADLDGSTGFRIDGLPEGFNLGEGLAGAGDVNNDGVDDLIVAQPLGRGPEDKGTVYLVFGRPSFPAVLDLNDLDGTDGVRINGVDRGDGTGTAVAGVGDFNGDGIDDFLIGADQAEPNGSGSGEAYLVFGAARWDETFELAELDGDNGFVLYGPRAGDYAGEAVSGAGDVNADGLLDIVIGAEFGFVGGESYVVFGTDQPPPSLDLEHLDGDNGFTVRAARSQDAAGGAVAGVGDLNDDGFDDLLIGAYAADPDPDRVDAGVSYLILGRDNWSAELPLIEFEETDGVVLHGMARDDKSGWSVSGAGDFNGDGAPDMMVGAPFATRGQSYVVFGRKKLPALIEYTAIDGTNGVTLDSGSNPAAGSSVASAGDFNGDGISDVLTGSTSGLGVGVAYVVFGRFETGITLGATAPTCPGIVKTRSQGLTPNGSMQLFRGSGRGSTPIQVGSCSGFSVDLADAQLVNTFGVDDRGRWLATFEVASPSICGTYMQLIDAVSCEVSNVTTVPSE